VCYGSSLLMCLCMSANVLGDRQEAMRECLAMAAKCIIPIDMPVRPFWCLLLAMLVCGMQMKAIHGVSVLDWDAVGGAVLMCKERLGATAIKFLVVLAGGMDEQLGECMLALYSSCQPRRCAWCHSRHRDPSHVFSNGAQRGRCCGCMIARYCGVACQRRAWKSHKRVCKAMNELAVKPAPPW
jgi:hypothetical protein